MNTTEKLTLAGFIGLVSTLVGISTGAVSIYESFSQQFDDLSLEVQNFQTQLEDKKHENIITRVNNAKLLLDNCEYDKDKKNELLHILSNSVKEATLFQNFEQSENELESVIPQLKDCDVYPEYVNIDDIEEIKNETNTQTLIISDVKPDNLPIQIDSPAISPKPVYISCNVGPCPQPDSLKESFLLSVPPDQVISSTDSTGRIIFFSTAAMDTDDGLLQPICNPKSGSKFSIGETTVHCKVVNSYGRQLSKTFTLFLELIN